MAVENEKENLKNSKKSQIRKAKKSGWFHIEHGVRRGVAGIILLAVAIVTAISFFGASGSFSLLIAESSRYLFGQASFFVPLTLFLMAFFVLTSDKKKILGSTVVGGSLFLLSMLGFFEILSHTSAGGKLG